MTLEDLWVAAYDPAVRRHMEHPTGSLADGFDRFCGRFADRAAMDFFGKRTSFNEMRDKAYRVAGNLRKMGVGPGVHVALLMPTCPQHVLAFYGVLLAGGTVVEHNPLFTTSELEPMFEDHGAPVAIVWDAAASVVQELPPHLRPKHVVSINMIEDMPLSKRALLRLPIKKARASRNQLSQPATGTVPFTRLLAPSERPPQEVRPKADDDALILYTSGTTGTPKGVPLTHRNLLVAAGHAAEWLQVALRTGDCVFLCSLPLFHIFGSSLSVNAGLTLGATLHLIPKPEMGLMLDAIERETPTLMVGVPTLFRKLLEAAEERGVSLKGLEVGICGGMPLPADLIHPWEKATGGLLIEGYGLSETSPILTGNPVNHTRGIGSIGIPFPDTQLRLADQDNPSEDVPMGEPGEILVKGEQVFRGYRNKPEETEAAFHDGWFRTGDIAVADERGFLKIVDRIKDMVITGGFNVYPTEVEDALRGENGVEDVAVVGLPNPLGMEEVVAAVVTKDGLIPDLDQIRAAAKQRLTAYKVPRRLVVVPELPKNALGKVLRREVRERLQALAPAEKVSRVEPSDWLGEITAKVSEIPSRMEKAGSDVREWIDSLELREKLEEMGDGVRSRLEDMDLREKLEDMGDGVRSRLEDLDLRERIEEFVEQVKTRGDDEPRAGSEPTDDAVPTAAVVDGSPLGEPAPSAATPDVDTAAVAEEEVPPVQAESYASEPEEGPAVPVDEAELDVLSDSAGDADGVGPDLPEGTYLEDIVDEPTVGSPLPAEGENWGDPEGTEPRQ